MPGLIGHPQKYGPLKPLKGVRITGSLHMTIETAILIETLVDRRRVRALGEAANIFLGRKTTPPPPLRFAGTPVFAHKGESLEEYWDFNARCAHASGQQRPATHRGRRAATPPCSSKGLRTRKRRQLGQHTQR